MVYRCILPDWAKQEFPDRPKVIEGEFTLEQIKKLNEKYYNIYYLPNYPSLYEKGVTVEGFHIDTFRFVFVDMDLKEGKHESKEAFIDLVNTSDIPPTLIVDSGNGVHVYWQVSDLDALSFLRLQRRLCRKFDTDEAVSKIYQLMRCPGSLNTKQGDDLKLCQDLFSSDYVYTCEDLDKLLPPITLQDEEYCKTHYDKTYSLNDTETKIDDKLPAKFGKLLRSAQEAKDIWSGNTDDRSKSDYRLGHIMFAHGFTKPEALSVLVNSAKALERAPKHRVNYALNIVDKIWAYEEGIEGDEFLSSSVRDILERGDNETLKGVRFPCYRYIDATAHGFRLGQVIGLVAGSGVGKTAMALNMFMGFVENNPDYVHFFVPLEQPAHEIADRWKTMCGSKTHLYDKVHVLDNYDKDGNFRHLSLSELKDYVKMFEQKTGKKVGAFVIDHIGALKTTNEDGENQKIINICHEMKPFAVQTNTMLIMQSQAPREKAGIGDLELNKDAAYGTVHFEGYCDYLITIWQPLKRCYKESGCPSVTSFKFCKIRHKKRHLDDIQEDVRYNLYFDSATEVMRELTQEEEDKSFPFFNQKATNLRKLDRAKDLLVYTSITWTKEPDGKADTDKNTGAA